MRTYQFPVFSVPAFSVPEDSPNYWNELASYRYVLMLQGLGAGYFQLEQLGPGDAASIDTAYSSVKGEIDASLSQGGDLSISDFVPTLSTLFSNLSSFSLEGGLLLVAKIIIFIFFKYLEGKQVASGGMSEELEEALIQMTADIAEMKSSMDLMQGDTESVQEALKRAFFNKLDEGGPYDFENLSALLFLLADPKIQILLEQKHGSVVDIAGLNFK